MLKAAQLYRDEIQKKYYECWYDLSYQYYGDGGHYEFNIPDNNTEWHMFASVTDGRVIGVINYHVDFGTRSASHFGAVSFERGNPVYARDLYQAISDIFDKYKLNRIEWRCIDGNPVLKSYRKFCKECGGQEFRLRQCIKTMDGQVRDSFIFEIIRSEWECYKFQKANKGYGYPLDIKNVPKDSFYYEVWQYAYIRSVKMEEIADSMGYSIRDFTNMLFRDISNHEKSLVYRTINKLYERR